VTFKCTNCQADDVGEMDPDRCGICGEFRKPYAVHFLTNRHGNKTRFSTFPEALAFYREHDGYALRNEERVGDGTEFDGLSAEEREQVEP
jgi:hypothetical protein